MIRFQVWSCYSVLNVLYSLIQKSKINEHIVAVREGKSEEEVKCVGYLHIHVYFLIRFFSEITGDYGNRPLYRMLGYFSIVCLLRVHVLLGDFTLALKVMENVELSQKVCIAVFLARTRMLTALTLQATLTRVTACHVSMYYHVGFCYLGLRRYPDAIRTFVSILNFIMRMRQYHTRSYQYDQASVSLLSLVPLSLSVLHRSTKPLTACTPSLLCAMRSTPVVSMTTS